MADPKYHTKAVQKLLHVIKYVLYRIDLKIFCSFLSSQDSSDSLCFLFLKVCVTMKTLF